MKLSTTFKLQKQTNHLIDYQSKILLLGSCFADNIAAKFEYFKFQSFSNPFGILYHPKAIEVLLKDAVDKKIYDASDVFFHNERWHCFEAHSVLSHPSQDILLSRLNDAITKTHQQIVAASHIIITFGTAWVYRFLDTDSIVANCHKIPQKQFKKDLLSIDEITNSIKHIITIIKSVNADANIIFTISPVRHLKDGFVENTLSKSHLISALHQVLNKSTKNNYYFPSYELMMDELRDYRFYADDLVHPNHLAIQYIWERFVEVWISDISHSTMKTIDDIQKGLQHKPFHPNSETYQKFIQTLHQKIEHLQKEHKHIRFDTKN
jgi:lysophospholipase L1-like esterase